MQISIYHVTVQISRCVHDMTPYGFVDVFMTSPYKFLYVFIKCPNRNLQMSCHSTDM